MTKPAAFLLSVYLGCMMPAISQVLYQCESPGGDSVTWIMGTMHYVSKENFIEDPLLDSLIANSDKVFSELFIRGSGNQQKIQASLGRNLQYPDNKTLAEFLSPQQIKSIYETYKKTGINKKYFNQSMRYIPFVQHDMLLFQENAYLRLDGMLEQKAAVLGKEHIGLDHPDSLPALYSYLAGRYNANWLLDVEKNIYNSREIERLYRNQDTAAIMKLFDDDEHTEILINKRNRYWQSVIETNRGRTNFIFVGLAHLIAGKDPMLEYFRTKGYSVYALPLRINK